MPRAWQRQVARVTRNQSSVNGRPMKKIIALLVCSFLVSLLFVARPAGANDERRKKILELSPQADTNGDGVLSAAEEEALYRKVLKRYPKVDKDGDGVLSATEKQALLRIAIARAKRERRAGEPAAAKPTSDKWNTPGFQRANTMGGGEAKISSNGKFRVFVLMGQSNMAGAARATELQAPYNQKHQRIRIWSHGRWEYLIPHQRFGPGVSMAHELAQVWPNDTIGIIKVAVGGTGIRGFEKNWSKARADRTFDGKKGPLYQDLMHAVTKAKQVSQPEFCGFVWKQGGADGSKKDLAEAYYDTFKQLVADVRKDLSTPHLPVLVLTYLSDEDLEKIEQPSGRRRYIKQVLQAHNQAGRDIPGVTAVHHGRLPGENDGINFNAEGQLKLGKMAADAIQKIYDPKE